MVQSLMRRDDATNVNLNDHVRMMGRAIVDYATKVLAMLDEEEPESITSVRDALRPLDAFPRELDRKCCCSRVSSFATKARRSNERCVGIDAVVSGTFSLDTVIV
ncbi:MAG: hypothetical protein IPM54_22825 [Polyangiaceae bacterium]|nr:hypothetical protein [Polyangiaceae bacterium]